VLGLDDLRRELRDNRPVHDVFARYTNGLLLRTMRLVGCTGLHSLEQRCARWILTTLDRAGTDQFSITHVRLAELLGASRPAVSFTVKDFHCRGLLTAGRARVGQVHRKALLAVSCDCYHAIQKSYERVS
jgi:CRP-like cAMP-binding protein